MKSINRFSLHEHKSDDVIVSLTLTKHKGYRGSPGATGAPGVPGQKGERGDVSISGRPGIPGQKGGACDPWLSYFLRHFFTEAT